MTLPRKNIFQTADNFLVQVSLQYSLEARSEVDENEDPLLASLLDSAIAEQTELLNADKFYDC